jgi:BirA family transcriptional regulator, biotin operon repressor / biotin---[acetyl-CoA-carboxylase] ligase
VSALSTAEVERALDALGARCGRPATVVASTASTNDDARRAAAAGAPDGALFVADAQTAGRGRGDHSWHSPPGENVYLSLLLRPQLPAPRLSSITLAFGLAVAKVVERRLEPGARVLVKWPNDVLVGPRKIAGILVEASLRGVEVGSLVVGVGLNVATERFPPEIAARATSLRIEGARELDRVRIVAELCHELGEAAEGFAAVGLTPLLDELARRDALAGRAVIVDGATFRAEGIDGEGRLRIRSERGELRSVVAGEVRLGVEA